MIPYKQLVFKLMSAWPTLFPSEQHCQNNIFLSRGSFDLNEDNSIAFNAEHWNLGEKGYEVDRSKESILGSEKNRSDNHEKFNRVEFKRYNSPMFYPIGCHNHLIRYEKYNTRCLIGLFLKDEVKLPEDYLEELGMFCQHILQINVEAFQLYRLAIYKQYKNGYPGWEYSFREECENIVKLQEIAKQVQDKLNPITEDKKKERDEFEKKQKELQSFIDNMEKKMKTMVEALLLD